jgi:hypothetical protein
MTKPVAFMSYAHVDDEGEDLTELRNCLERVVRQQTAEQFDIFKDRDDIAWGQNWRERIHESLDHVTFLIPIITPSYFESENCRKELQRFIEREKELNRNDLILPIYYRKVWIIEDKAEREQDEDAKLIATRQRADWRELINKSYESEEVKVKVEELGQHISLALERLRKSRTSRVETGSGNTQKRLDHRRGLKVVDGDEHGLAEPPPEVIEQVETKHLDSIEELIVVCNIAKNNSRHSAEAHEYQDAYEVCRAALSMALPVLRSLRTTGYQELKKREESQNESA